MNISSPRKVVIHFLRHGQATHNVTAEGMKANGCTFQAFVDQMRKDDEFDSNLTNYGINQAFEAGKLLPLHFHKQIELIVSSPLSRAIDTADLVMPFDKTPEADRKVIEDFREVSGLLLNAKRRSRSDLIDKYNNSNSYSTTKGLDSPQSKWDFSMIGEEDELWDDSAIEAKEDCAHRCYKGLLEVWNLTDNSQRPYSDVAIAAHGGIFGYLFAGLNPHVRIEAVGSPRFGNCEMKSCEMSIDESGGVEGGATKFVIRQFESSHDVARL